ncbi:hypothetical protein SLEP1_g10857 [Rubroshorea leprosula]|uniref:Pentatricopeptide repeat-containing protein n=1 Tax=Rubroshorea leprosula TaxID=152421 RepID=A0AAV5IKA2_9ROSI|nr:hypothetical protein SLEP1_g10857 [Rubroshorea leprosula]
MQKAQYSNSRLQKTRDFLNRVGLTRLGSSLYASTVKNPEFFDPENPDDFNDAPFIWNSTLSDYAKCGDQADAPKLFDEMPVTDSISWNSDIWILRNGELEGGFGYFKSCEAQTFVGWIKNSDNNFVSL